MSERKMEIMVLDKEDFREHLFRRAYEEKEYQWLDEHWEELCDYAESSQNKLIFKKGIKNHLTCTISRELGNNRLHIYIEEITWHSVKKMHEVRNVGPDGIDLFIVEISPIPKDEKDLYLMDEEFCDLPLNLLFDLKDSNFSYIQGSASLEDHGDTATMCFEVHQTDTSQSSEDESLQNKQLILKGASKWQ